MTQHEQIRINEWSSIKKKGLKRGYIMPGISFIPHMYLNIHQYIHMYYIHHHEFMYEYTTYVCLYVCICTLSVIMHSVVIYTQADRTSFIILPKQSLLRVWSYTVRQSRAQTLVTFTFYIKGSWIHIEYTAFLTVSF